METFEPTSFSTNGVVHMSEQVSENEISDSVAKELRVLNKKNKRFHSNSFSHSGPNGFNSNFDLSELDVADLSSALTKEVSIPLSKLANGKNSKKSKSKKAGGGGKGMWSKAGLIMDDHLELDHDDPDYDSDVNDSIQLKRVDPVMKEDEFDDSINCWLKEYFVHGDYKELAATLSEVNMTVAQRFRLPYLAIGLAIQGKPTQCELTSELLSALCGTVLTGEEMESGFDFLLKELADLTLDSPNAPESVGRFIARAVADDVLPPKFVQRLKARTSAITPAAGSCSAEEIQALAKAENLLSLSHAYARLDSVWGLKGGIKATKLLVKKIRLLLCEYLCSNDTDEATRCLRELDVPHFHHELVYQAIQLAIEKSTEEATRRMIRLLDSLCQSVVVTVDQLERGVERIYADMPDIQLDVPAAYILLERLISQGVEAKFITHKLIQQMPAKGRKRFVSDGDGGLFKKKSLQP